MNQTDHLSDPITIVIRIGTEGYEHAAFDDSIFLFGSLSVDTVIQDYVTNSAV